MPRHGQDGDAGQAAEEPPVALAVEAAGRTVCSTVSDVGQAAGERPVAPVVGAAGKTACNIQRQETAKVGSKEMQRHRQS